MLAHAVQSPATSTTTSTSITTPTRPSRLRGLSYLRSLSSRSDAPPLVRSTSSPNTSTLGSGAQQTEVPAVPQADQSRITAATPTMSRNRSSTTSGPTPTIAVEHNASGTTLKTEQTIRFIPHIEARSSRPSLHFTAVTKTLKSSAGKIRVGRYTEREATPQNDEVLPVGFKSKVVSRRHCEFWCTNGQWYVKDVKSSSGTFLNHVRLSSPSTESRPFPVNDGDVVQLGIDFKGGEEVIFRCVKIRIECNRGWQKTPNTFNTTTHKKLLKTVAGKSKRDSDTVSVNNHECSICLNPITPCQSLFVAPCSHVWHYKCVRGLINGPNYPNFLCPNCRLVADLEADVEPPEDDFIEEDVDSEHEAEAIAGSSDEAPVAAGATTSDTSSDSTGDDALAQANILGSGMTTPTRARPIPMPSIKHQRSPDAGLTTPGAPAAFAHIADGLLTPRNDAGPFVFDGSAGLDRAAADEDYEMVSPPREQD